MDDELDILEFLQDILEEEGYAVVTSDQETKSIPIIMFSAHPSAEETARRAGAEDFLEKPFDIDVLLAKIAQFL